MTLDPDSFRAALGRFASSVTVITSRGADGRDMGMTASAFCSLSLDPPLVLVCVDQAASLHPVLIVGQPFAVNILASDQEALSRRFAGTELERFEGLGFSRGAAGPALLDDVLAHLECRVEMLHRGGDHTICVGRVDAVNVNRGHPLLYYRGGYAQLDR
ncbi:MAG: flavin reductase family protein [Gemmatimonadaceae bacterium]